jgi:hypothetical protein
MTEVSKIDEYFSPSNTDEKVFSISLEVYGWRSTKKNALPVRPAIPIVPSA